MMMTTFSLFPRWEFTAAAYIFNSDDDPRTDDATRSSFYAKYMSSRTREDDVRRDGPRARVPELGRRALRTLRDLWMNSPITLPLFDNNCRGQSARVQRDAESARVTNGRLLHVRDAHGVVPTSPSGRSWGGLRIEGPTRPSPSTGRVEVEPSQHAVFAISYDDEFNGNDGAGWEVGVMLFTPFSAALRPRPARRLDRSRPC